MISFAQNLEDVLIARFFKGDEPQTYVDVGAGHPIYHSVTKHFYQQGWQGINIEPRGGQFALLKYDRPLDQNICACVSNESGELNFFEVAVQSDDSQDNGGLSTLDPDLARHYREQGYHVVEFTVPVKTLSAILEEQHCDEIGFLKIDVEGHELQVVEGLDWKRWRPRLVVLECTVPLSESLAETQAAERVRTHGYELAFFDGLNQFLVREEDADRVVRLATPANVFDEYTRHREVELCMRLEEAEQKARKLEQQLMDRQRDLEFIQSHMLSTSERG